MLEFGVRPPSKQVMKDFYDQVVEVLFSSKKGLWRVVVLEGNLCVGVTGPINDVQLSFYDFADSQSISFAVDAEGTTIMSTASKCPAPDVILQRMELLLARVKQLHITVKEG